MTTMKRGDIYWGSVPPEHSLGHEQHNEPHKPRPWLIVSTYVLQRGGIVIACPITTTRNPAPELSRFHIELDDSMIKSSPTDSRLDGGGTVLCEQLRAMSVERFKVTSGHPRAGRLTQGPMGDVERAVMDALAVDFDDE